MGPELLPSTAPTIKIYQPLKRPVAQSDDFDESEIVLPHPKIPRLVFTDIQRKALKVGIFSSF